MTKVFIAGIMQASRSDRFIESQNYRQQITAVLQEQIPQVDIIDPFATNPNSVDYNDQQAEFTFISNTRKASQVDFLIAYLPVASLGTAMEMWQAYEAGVTILTVSPLQHHWAIKFTSDEVFPDLESLFDAIRNGRWQNWIHDKAERIEKRKQIG
ncbi:MAG: hypothetical protein AAF490_11245 [Chloroflexota bacterium]